MIVSQYIIIMIVSQYIIIMIVSQYIIIMIHYIYSNNLFTYRTGTVLYGYILYIYGTVP